MIGKTCGEINIGDKSDFSKTISETDIYMLAGVTGDLNPIHINSELPQGVLFSVRELHMEYYHLDLYQMYLGPNSPA